MRFDNTSSLRKKVAKEAASLLYFEVEKEYKQAKLKASKTFGVNFLPTNREVAMAFDIIADENEGALRRKRLIRMRRKAFELMKVLEEYHPMLVGSVWRGTIHRGSDIDITVYHDDSDVVLQSIIQNNLEVTHAERTTVTKHGSPKTSFHIYLGLPSQEKAEIIVRNHEEIRHREKCEIFGDTITGLSIADLKKLLHKNPEQRFVPF